MRKKITDRLSFKVFVITFIVQILFGAIICSLLYSATPSSWNSARRKEIQAKFDEFVSELHDVPFIECGPVIDEFILSNNCDIALYKGKDVSLEDYPVAIPNTGYALLTKHEVYERIRNNDNKEMTLTTTGQVIFKNNEGPVYTVMGIWDQKDENVLWEALKNTMPLIIVAILLISLLCSFIYTYLFARPVRKLSELSGRIADMDFTARSGAVRRDEIGDLGRDLDNLSQSLDETITSLNSRTKELEEEIKRVGELERQKDVFFAAASHELKTPITIAQGQVRGMIEGVEPFNDTDTYLPKTLAALKRMESLINEILTASRMQADNEIELRREDLGSVLKAKILDTKDLLDVRGVPLETNIDDDLFFEGNSELTSMAMGSFLSNAVFYSSDDSKVSVTARKEDKNIVTYIRNTNAHIDEKDLPHLFEAFYRTDSSRDRRSGGSGLGLYLGKLIIERQNGTVSLDNDGDDVVAKVTLPAST